MVNIENGEIETPATLFRYLRYLKYLVPVVPANLISDILVSSAFQKYITPMVNTEKNLIQGTYNTFQIPDILVSAPFQKYITLMVFSENLI